MATFGRPCTPAEIGFDCPDGTKRLRLRLSAYQGAMASLGHVLAHHDLQYLETARYHSGTRAFRKMTWKGFLEQHWDQDQILATNFFTVEVWTGSGLTGFSVQFSKLTTKLLEDRFKLKIHFEDRMVPAYALSSVKPKMAKADPTTRTGCYAGPGPDGKDPRVANPLLSRLLYCLNVTMAQFADQISQRANGYVHSAVLDKTGLADTYLLPPGL